MLPKYQVRGSALSYNVSTITERFQPDNLTNGAQNPYPESMPQEGNGEVQKTPGKPQESAGETIVHPVASNPHESPQELSQMARRSWEKMYGGRGQKLEDLPFGERQTVEMAIKEGHPPSIKGGAESIPRDEYTNRRILPIVDEINAEIIRNGVDNPLNARFISDQLRRIRDLIDQGVVDDAQGNRLLGQLNLYMDEVTQAEAQQRQSDYERQARARESRYYPDLDEVRELLTDRAKRDEEFNDIFAGVDATPNEFFDRAFNPLTLGTRYEEFMDLIRNASAKGFEGIDITDDGKKALASDLRRYQLERQIRQSLHDANAILYLPSIKGEQLWDNMQQFDSTLGDFAMKQQGVRQMMDLYEEALRESMTANDGYLKPEAVRGEDRKRTEDVNGVETVVTYFERGSTEEKAKARFTDMMLKQQIFSRAEDGRAIPIKNLADWEIDRVFTTARGMMVMSERLLSIAAESKLPKLGGAITSLFLQDVLQSYAPYIHLLAKYGLSESGLAAYLYTHQDGKSFLETLRGWNPRELEKILKQFEENPMSVLDQPLEGGIMTYLTRRNPNRAGDIFTWLSWRAGDRPDVVSMTQQFLVMGKEKMLARSQSKTFSNDQEREVYENEYSNWIGTGARLERIRGRIEDYKEKLASGDKKTIEETEEALNSARGILSRMAELQPHRLFSVSEDIRNRIASQIESEGWSPSDIEIITGNLQMVESELYRNREALLDRGETFSTVSLDEFYDRIIVASRNEQGELIFDDNGNIVIDQAATDIQRAQVRRFAEIIKEDFARNGELYEKEFITLREYKHGFVLWSGDIPIDEFNVAAIGPTGGFARRARDNKNQSEAAVEEIALLSSLKYIKTPEQAFAALARIYDKVAAYDSGKAKQGTMEKAEGIMKFFMADGVTNIPIMGQALKVAGHSSLAQLLYGKTAGVWEAVDRRNFINDLKNKKLIDARQYKHLEKYCNSSKIDVGVNLASTMSQLLAIAILLYMAQKVASEKA